VIGVLSKPEQASAVEEFFELFKTPWEYFRPECTYDVVLATVDDIPDVDTSLLLIYGSKTTSKDAASHIDVDGRTQGASLRYQDDSLPIYGPLATFKRDGAGHCAAVTESGSIAGLQLDGERRSTIRLGYDLFQEVQFLISTGQPISNARIPALDLHIRMLRSWIVDAGVPLVEITPSPSGYAFAVCLTHDIDFVGIRGHRFDHSMWGFVYRSTVGTMRDIFRRRVSLARVFRIWRALASLPFVYLGWVKDFWEPFDWYLQVEKGLPATYFLIPFKRRAGERVPGRHASRRATAYDVTDLPQWTAALANAGCEIGVHGIDAWHSVEKGGEERARIATVTGESSVGIRMHWLLKDAQTASVLEEAGYAYDSTVGYNETVGYRAGTTQVFRPSGAETLLELPLHIQDGALFYPARLDLSEPEADQRCRALTDNARRLGGVLTVLWHDRSHGPERFWGDFYARLVRTLRSEDAWFGTAAQVVAWFRKRRAARFERDPKSNGGRTWIRYEGEPIVPALNVRIHRPLREHRDGGSDSGTLARVVDMAWDGRLPLDIGASTRLTLSSLS
jgi:hypothetical protein